MKRMFMSFLSIFFPWIVLFINDDPVGGALAMIMQVTIIGWIPAVMWARRSMREEAKKKKQNKSKET